MSARVFLWSYHNEIAIARVNCVYKLVGVCERGMSYELLLIAMWGGVVNTEFEECVLGAG
jgi:hypothetical protein